MNNMLNTAIKAVSAAAIVCREIQAQLISEDALTKKEINTKKQGENILDY